MAVVPSFERLAAVESIDRTLALSSEELGLELRAKAADRIHGSSLRNGWAQTTELHKGDAS